MQLHSSESDPAIQQALNIEQNLKLRFEAENQQRLEMSMMVTEGKVPSYDQLVTAREWVTNIRNSGHFDAEGKLIEADGLTPVYEEDLNKTEAYFNPSNWKLSPRELLLAKSITDNYHPNKIDKLKILAGVSPRFGTELSKDLAGVSTPDRLDKIDAMAQDVAAMVKLDSAIKKAEDAEDSKESVEGAKKKEALLGLNLEKAIHELNKPDGPVNKGTRSDIELDTGLTYGEKNGILIDAGHKTKDQRTSEKSPKFKASEAERTGAISNGLRKVGIQKLPSRGGTRREKIRRFVNGSETKPAVAARHKLETTIKLNTELLKDDGLSAATKKRLEKRVEKAQNKIQRGSRINPNKYGEAVSRKGAARESATYDPSKMLESVQSLKTERDTIEDGNFARQIHASLRRETGNPEKTIDASIKIDDRSFNEILDAIGTRFDNLIDIQKHFVKPGERLEDYKIDHAYIEAQLLVAREIVDDHLAAQNVKVDAITQSAYVRQLLEAFHAYTPPTETKQDTQKQSTQSRPTPAQMPKKRSQRGNNPRTPQSYEDVQKFFPNA